LLDKISVVETEKPLPLSSKEALYNYLLPLLDEEPEHDENLIDYGLTSIDVMKLVSALREGGVEINFDDLARALSIDGIWAAIENVQNKGA